jgi:hypothetical protein
MILVIIAMYPEWAMVKQNFFFLFSFADQA